MCSAVTSPRSSPSETWLRARRPATSGDSYAGRSPPVATDVVTRPSRSSPPGSRRCRESEPVTQIAAGRGRAAAGGYVNLGIRLPTAGAGARAGVERDRAAQRERHPWASGPSLGRTMSTPTWSTPPGRRARRAGASVVRSARSFAMILGVRSTWPFRGDAVSVTGVISPNGPSPCLAGQMYGGADDLAAGRETGCSFCAPTLTSHGSPKLVHLLHAPLTARGVVTPCGQTDLVVLDGQATRFALGVGGGVEISLPEVTIARSPGPQAQPVK